MANWIIAIGNTAIDGIELYQYSGTINEVKALLLEFVNRDKQRDEKDDYLMGCFKNGPKTVDDIDDTNPSALYTNAEYETYHIDYTAKEIDSIDIIF